jgi:hypothetical protein
VFDRPLKNEAEKRIVARNERRMSLSLADRVGDAADHRYVDQAVGGICRGLDENHRNPAFANGVRRREADRGFVDPIGEADRADRQTCKRLGEQGFGPTIERLGMQNHVAWADEGEDRGRDRRHAGREQRAFVGALVDGEPVLDDLAVRVIEARINQTRAHPFGRFAPTRHKIEEVLTVLGCPEHEGRGQEDGWLDGSFRQLRIVPIFQHQGFGMQHVVADVGFDGNGFTMVGLAVWIRYVDACAEGRFRSSVARKSRHTLHPSFDRRAGDLHVSDLPLLRIDRRVRAISTV